jgi:hypothetical protein
MLNILPLASLLAGSLEEVVEQIIELVLSYLDFICEFDANALQKEPELADLEPNFLKLELHAEILKQTAIVAVDDLAAVQVQQGQVAIEVWLLCIDSLLYCCGLLLNGVINASTQPILKRIL